MNRLEDKNDALDPMLRAYYRAEMPHPWPGPPARHKTMLPPRKESGWLAWASSGRFALALSVANHLMGAWALSGLGTRPNLGPPVDPEGGVAGKNGKGLEFPKKLQKQLDRQGNK